MKKLLLATTALTLSAGVAAADVALSGDARMGITHDSSLTSNKTAFTSRARVTFTLSGETDTGVAFGGSFRADNASGAAAGTAGSVFVSSDFGRLTMGDTSGAAEARNGDLAGVGLTGLGDQNEFTYLSNAAAGRPTARYDYSIDGFTFSLSHTNPGVASKVASVGVSYTIEGFTVGLGAERQNSSAGTNAVAADGVTFTPAVAAVAAVGRQTHLVASVGYSMDNISVKAMYGRNQTAAVTAAENTPGTGVAIAKSSAKQYGLSATGTFDAVSVTAFGRRDFAEDTHAGLGASYDLGGGASLRGGVVNTNFNAAGVKSRTVADLGLAFSF